jgi:hypothetical protein
MIKKSVFTTQAAKSHKPGYRATGKALFVPRHDNAALRQLLETYFNPMAYISHHVSVFANIQPSSVMTIADSGTTVWPAACRRTHGETHADQPASAQGVDKRHYSGTGHASRQQQAEIHCSFGLRTFSEC